MVGPIKTMSLGRKRCFVTALDKYTGYHIVWFVYRKNEIGDAVNPMIKEIENFLKWKIKTVLRGRKEAVSVWDIGSGSG